MQTRPNRAGPYQQGWRDGKDWPYRRPWVRPAGKNLSGQGRSMKDHHVPRNGLCLLPSQHTDNHISFKDPLRARAGEASYLSHLQSRILDALAMFQMHVNVELERTDGDKGCNVLVWRKWKQETNQLKHNKAREC